jgi:molecular chaperone GrpE
MNSDSQREIPINFVGSEQETRDPDSEREDETPAADLSAASAGPPTGKRTAAHPNQDQLDSNSVNDDSDDDLDGPSQALEDARKQIDALTQERTTLYDQLLRRQAEFDNFRKRVDRDRTETYHRSRAEFLLELLPVVDNFERALASAKSEGGAESLQRGVELIHKQLKDALMKLGLQEIETVGQSFDPHLHEAITIEPTDAHQENTVIEEFQRGYKLGDRLLRPAKVKVAASPER